MTLLESVIFVWGMNMRVVVFLLLVALASGCASPSQTLSSREPVSTDTGSVVAYQAEDNILQWYDIPYAQAPVGDLRWRAPKALPVADAPIVRSADPIICPQEAGFVSGVEGESARIINSYEAGECFKPEDKNDFLTKLNKIYIKKVSGSNSYYEGLTRLANDFNRQVLAKRMLDLIKSFL